MATVVHLVRHGQTIWNVEKRMQGQTDSPLTDRGLRQARALAGMMEKTPLDRVVASPLGRAFETAKILSSPHGLAVEKEPLLAEISLGLWEGRLQADLDVEDGERHRNFWERPERFSLPDGESFFDVGRRAQAFLDLILDKYPNERLLAVSHTGLIRSLLFCVDPRPMSAFWEEPAVYPTSRSELRHDGEQWETVRIADISHYLPEEYPEGKY